MTVDTNSIESAAPERSPFMIRVFGSTGFEHERVPVSIGGKRQQRLLALLAVRAGETVELDWLAEYLWSDHERPERPEPPLRTYVSRLRRSFPEGARDWIETETGGYRLRAPIDAVDSLQFGALRAEAARARAIEDPLTASRLLDEALDLWRGDPFRELEDCDWAQPEIERLRQDRLEILEERWETALALGRHTQITGELAAFVNQHGLRDRAVRQYALALHRSGRKADALQVIATHRHALADQSGLDPSRELVELERLLLADDPELDAKNLGRPLRGYRLLEEVGSGAFSIVWRGLQPSVDREVAIKQIRAELATQPDFIRRFEAEAHVVARIEHPHVVPLIDFWRDPDSAYLVMRWLGGGTLERRLDDGPLNVADALLLAGQIGGALAAAHAQGVVHRDVKAANVMFDEQGHAYLTDFGIALNAEESGGPEAALSQGTPSYASPEQTRRETLGPTADIFSLGVVLYECLTGTLPTSIVGPGGATEVEQTLRPPSVAELRVEVPQSISDAIARAMAFDPTDRFETVADFLTALAPIAPDLSEPVDGLEAAPGTNDPENPYLGLHAFDGGDSHRFFGRERLIAELVERLSGDLVSSRCVVLVGPSGSGKSSVVKAGLIPALQRGEVPGSDAWFTTSMVPGINAYESLEAALLRIAVNPPNSLLSQLCDGKRGVLRSLRRCLGSDEDRVLLVIDQFEELFVGPSSEQADSVLDALAVALEDPSSPLRLVITVRADYYDRPLQHPAFAAIVKACAVEVTPLAGDELERAIVEPARQVGLQFEGGLVARLTADAVGQTAPLPLLQYTLSELFDQRDGRLLTLGAYDEIGGLSGALAARAEALYSQADTDEQVAIRTVFGRLTNPAQTSADLRRRVPVANLGVDPAAAWVIEEYGKARLLTFDREVGSREPTVEVAHEALLREWPRLENWLDEDRELLQAADQIAAAADIWSAGDRADADLYRGPRLETAIDLSGAGLARLRPVDLEFVDASRSAALKQRVTEASRIRRLRRLVAGIAAALVVALIAGGLAVRQSNRADDQATRAQTAAALADEQRSAAQEAAQRAEASAADAAAQAEIAGAQTEAAQAATRQAELATLISRSAAQQSQDAELSVLLALEAHRRDPTAETQQAVLSALGSTQLGNRIATNRPMVDPASPCPHHTLSSDGARIFGVRADRLVSQDVLTGVIRDHGPTPRPCVRWYGDEVADRRVAVSDDGRHLWLGPFAGAWEVDREFSDSMSLVRNQFSPTGTLVFRTTRTSAATAQKPAVMLIDDRTGEQRGPTISAGRLFWSAAVSGDGALVVLSFGFNPDVEDAGVTVVVDGNSGQELRQFRTALPVAQAVIDDQTQELIVDYLWTPAIHTIDVYTGEIVAQIETTARGAIVGGGLGIASDGSIVAVSGGSIERLDRRSGPVGPGTPVQNVAAARVRRDGTVLTSSPDNQTAIVDLDSNSLVEQSWPVEVGSAVEIHDGVATIVALGGSDPETIDLPSGRRQTHVLTTPEGEPYVPHGAHDTPAGLWTLHPSLPELIRWQQGVEEQGIQLGFPTSTKRADDLWAINFAGTAGLDRAALVDLAADPPKLLLHGLPAPSLAALHPSPTRGVYILDRRGRLRTYDAAGIRTHQMEIPEADLTSKQFPVTLIVSRAMAVDPMGARLAILGAEGEVILVDPASSTYDVLPGVDGVRDFAFLRDGELLAIVEGDGSIVLWDVGRNEPAGRLWQGTGATSFGSIVWYDEISESMWAATSGKIIEISIDPDRWIERACQVVGRDFTQAEWDRLVPGDEPLTSACP